MAHLIKKTVKGRPYWYARECQRVKGRVVTVWQRYLGPADTIVARLTQPPPAPPAPAEIHVCHAGHVAALYDAAQQIGLVECIDRGAPKRAQGPSPGQFMLVAAIHRICAPCGTLSMQDWLAHTPLPRWLGHAPAAFDSQAFWNHMHRMPLSAMRAVKHELAATVERAFDLPLRTALFDETNDYTFINTFNDRSTKPQHGHNKHKRTDLCHVSLLLLRGVLLRTLRAANRSLTPEQALQQLEGIMEVAHIYPDGTAVMTTNSVTPTQRALYELFHLDRWIAPLLGTTR